MLRGQEPKDSRNLVLLYAYLRCDLINRNPVWFLSKDVRDLHPDDELEACRIVKL